MCNFKNILILWNNCMMEIDVFELSIIKLGHIRLFLQISRIFFKMQSYITSRILNPQTCECRNILTFASHSIPATEMPSSKMTVSVPTILMSLISSVMRASILWQTQRQQCDYIMKHYEWIYRDDICQSVTLKQS